MGEEHNRKVEQSKRNLSVCIFPLWLRNDLTCNLKLAAQFQEVCLGARSAGKRTTEDTETWLQS